MSLHHLMTKPTGELGAQLKKERLVVDLAPRPMLGVHLRRGDSCDLSDSLKRGRVCSHGAEYAKEVAELIVRYGFRSVFAASDSEDAVRELRAALATAHGGIMRHVPVLVSGLDANSTVRDDKVRQAKSVETGLTDGTFNAFSEFKSVLTDLVLLSECEGFVGKFTSNLDRIAYSRMTARSGCHRPYVSLDAPWCFERKGVSPIGAKEFGCMG